MSVTTTTGKPIGDYEDYHTEDGQPIADVSYFEQDAVIPLSGKYNQSDAKKTTKSVKLSDVIGGGGGGGGYTPVTITPDQSALSDSTLTVNLQNHTLVTLDLSNIDPTAGGKYGIEEVRLIAPEVASGDYTDIIVQIKPYNDTDGIDPVAYVMESGEPVKLVPTPFVGDSFAKNLWVHVHIIGRMYIRYNEETSGS